MLLYLVSCLTAIDCLPIPQFTVLENHRLPDGILVDVTSQVDCQFTCWEDSVCVASDYELSTNKCWLHFKPEEKDKDGESADGIVLIHVQRNNCSGNEAAVYLI